MLQLGLQQAKKMKIRTYVDIFCSFQTNLSYTFTNLTWGETYMVEVRTLFIFFFILLQYNIEFTQARRHGVRRIPSAKRSTFSHKMDQNSVFVGGLMG